MTPKLSAREVADSNRGVCFLMEGQFDSLSRRHSICFRKLVEQNPRLALSENKSGHRPIESESARQRRSRSSRQTASKKRARHRIRTILRAQYCRAILLFNGSNPAAALEFFQQVAQADPQDAYAAYYTGRCLFEAEKFSDAMSWYRKAIAIDPFLQSAYYGAFQTLQRTGDAKGAEEMLAVFQRLATNPQAQEGRHQIHADGPEGDGHNDRPLATAATKATRGATVS